MEKRTVVVTVEFTFDITQDEIDAGNFDEATTFEEALQKQIGYVEKRMCPIMDLVDDYDELKWKMEFENE